MYKDEFTLEPNSAGFQPGNDTLDTIQRSHHINSESLLQFDLAPWTSSQAPNNNFNATMVEYPKGSKNVPITTSTIAKASSQAQLQKAKHYGLQGRSYSKAVRRTDHQGKPLRVVQPAALYPAYNTQQDGTRFNDGGLSRRSSDVYGSQLP